MIPACSASGVLREAHDVAQDGRCRACGSLAEDPAYREPGQVPGQPGASADQRRADGWTRDRASGPGRGAYLPFGRWLESSKKGESKANGRDTLQIEVREPAEL